MLIKTHSMGKNELLEARFWFWMHQWKVHSLHFPKICIINNTIVKNFVKIQCFEAFNATLLTYHGQKNAFLVRFFFWMHQSKEYSVRFRLIYSEKKSDLRTQHYLISTTMRVCICTVTLLWYFTLIKNREYASQWKSNFTS